MRAGAGAQPLGRKAIVFRGEGLLGGGAVKQDRFQDRKFRRAGAGPVALRQPGIELLTEVIALASVRPDISTGMLLAHFDDREEAPALQKLASQSLPGDEAIWQAELHDVIAQLNRQVMQQQIDALLDLQRGGALDAAGKQELRDLLAQRGAGIAPG